MENYKIKNKTDDIAEIFIYGDIVANSWDGDDWTAKELNDELNKLEDIEELDIRINSSGGNVFQGLSIYNSIKKFARDNDIKIISYIDGIAASISSVIPLAADKVIMAEDSFYMIHQPFSQAIGTAKDLRDRADVLDKVADTLMNTYQNKTVIDKEDLKEMMDEETWFNSIDALEYGFVDEIEDYNIDAKVKGDTLIMNSVEFDLNQYEKIPNIKEKISNKISKKDDDSKGGKDMYKTFETEEDFENFKEELLTGYIKAENVLDKFSELDLEGEDLDDLVDRVKEIKNEANEAKEELEQIKRDNKFQNRKEKLEEVGIEIEEDDKEEILNMSEKALELLIESNKEKIDNKNDDKDDKNFMDFNFDNIDDGDANTAKGL